MPEYRCCICKKLVWGYGNNPDPVKKEGECCDSCNSGVVMPMRLAKLFKEVKK